MDRYSYTYIVHEGVEQQGTQMETLGDSWKVRKEWWSRAFILDYEHLVRYNIQIREIC